METTIIVRDSSPSRGNFWSLSLPSRRMLIRCLESSGGGVAAGVGSGLPGETSWFVQQRQHRRQVEQRATKQRQAEHQHRDHDPMRAPEAAPVRHTGGTGVIHVSNQSAPRRASTSHLY